MIVCNTTGMAHMKDKTKLLCALQDAVDMTMISLVRSHISHLLTTFSAAQLCYTKLYLILCSRRAIHYLYVTTAYVSCKLTSLQSDWRQNTKRVNPIKIITTDSICQYSTDNNLRTGSIRRTVVRFKNINVL